MAMHSAFKLNMAKIPEGSRQAAAHNTSFNQSPRDSIATPRKEFETKIDSILFANSGLAENSIGFGGR